MILAFQNCGSGGFESDSPFAGTFFTLSKQALSDSWIEENIPLCEGSEVDHCMEVYSTEYETELSSEGLAALPAIFDTVDYSKVNLGQVMNHADTMFSSHSKVVYLTIHIPPSMGPNLGHLQTRGNFELVFRKEGPLSFTSIDVQGGGLSIYADGGLSTGNVVAKGASSIKTTAPQN